MLAERPNDAAAKKIKADKQKQKPTSKSKLDARICETGPRITKNFANRFEIFSIIGNPNARGARSKFKLMAMRSQAN